MMRSSDWRALAGVIAGEVIRPGSPGYDAARRPAIARFADVWPQAVVRCRAPDDVAEVISLARRSGTPAAIRSGGHCFAGRSSTQGIVIDVSPMSAVSVSGGVATAGAGTRLGDLGDVLTRHGLAVPTGCGDGVGISGLTLGGGLGILGRSYGLTCDSLLAAQVVLADGRVVACGEDQQPDLFCALRGAGGGAFGVVTSLTFRTIPAPAATVFRLDWPGSLAAQVLAAWQAWAPTGPGELAASLLLTAPPDTAKQVKVTVHGAMLGSEAGAELLLAELATRVGTDPADACLRYLPFREAKRWLSRMHPAQDLPLAHSFSKSEYFARLLPDQAIAGLAAAIERDRTPGESRELDFTPWAGAYSRVRPDATAFAHRNALFLLKHAVTVDEAGAARIRAAQRWPTRSCALVHPYGTGGVYPNFPDPDLRYWARAYHGGNYARLRRVKARYDPGNFFRFPQSVPPGATGMPRSRHESSTRGHDTEP
jgi:FAD/FMN-containing dehydrogenase